MRVQFPSGVPEEDEPPPLEGRESAAPNRVQAGALGFVWAEVGLVHSPVWSRVFGGSNPPAQTNGRQFPGS